MPKRLSIKILQKLAKSKGGKCLSKKYTNGRSKYKWKCSEGHTWEAIVDNIKYRGSWCGICDDNKRKPSISDLQKLAKKNSGECLSKKYVNDKKAIKWKCFKGHTWKARVSNIKIGQWCNKCRNLTIEEMQDHAKKNKGICLSKVYKNSNTKIKWKCSKGHIFKSKPDSVIYRDTWCPYCANIFPLTIKEMKKIAKSRNGKCLSRTYKNSDTHLKWMCSEGHIWKASPNRVKNAGNWCPKCKIWFSESICKTTFEQIFNTKFPKHYPRWLINSRGNQMELDGYSKKYQIAFEYNGIQHFKISPFSKTQKLLQIRINDDKLKRKLCKKHKIYLFTISYKNNLQEIPKLIKNVANKIENIPNDIDFGKIINFDKIYKEKTKINFLKNHAKKLDGVCLSKNYLGDKEYLMWKCSKGHIWKATPNAIKRGTWCPVCIGKINSPNIIIGLSGTD
jgi:hypothetical protein